MKLFTPQADAVVGNARRKLRTLGTGISRRQGGSRSVGEVEFGYKAQLVDTKTVIVDPISNRQLA